MEKLMCPCCQSEKNTEINLHSDGFAENLFECSNCEAKWLHKHGAEEILVDSNSNSFLEADPDYTDGTCPNIV